MRKTLLVLVLLLAANNAWGDTVQIQTGHDFLRVCKDVFEENFGKTRDEVEMTGFCLGYLEGIKCTSRDNYHYCLPESVDRRQLVKIAYRFMQNHPEVLDRHPYIAIMHSFAGVFPCRKK